MSTQTGFDRLKWFWPKLKQSIDNRLGQADIKWCSGGTRWWLSLREWDWQKVIWAKLKYN